MHHRYSPHLITGAVHNSNDIALKVQNIVVNIAIIADRHRPSFCIVGQAQKYAFVLDLRKLSILVIHISTICSAGIPAYSQTIGIVAEAPCGRTGGRLFLHLV